MKTRPLLQRFVVFAPTSMLERIPIPGTFGQKIILFNNYLYKSASTYKLYLKGKLQMHTFMHF